MIQDACLIPDKIKQLKLQHKRLGVIQNAIYEEYNNVGTELIDLIAKWNGQKNRVSKTRKESKEGKKEVVKSSKTNKKGRSRVQSMDQKKRQLPVRSSKRKVLPHSTKRSSNKKGKEVNKVQRTKLQQSVQLSQLPTQPISRDLHELVGKKVRTRKVRTVSKRKPTNKKVVQVRVRRVNKKI